MNRLGRGEGGTGPPAAAISSAKGVVRRGYPSEVPGTPYMANLRGLLFLCVNSSCSPSFLFLRTSCQGSGCVNLISPPSSPSLSKSSQTQGNPWLRTCVVTDHLRDGFKKEREKLKTNKSPGTYVHTHSRVSTSHCCRGGKW